MNPHRTNDPALRAEHIARKAAKHARWSIEVHVQVYNQAIIEIAGNTNTKGNDELIAENKSNHSVGVEYRDSAQRLSVQVEDLQRQVTTRNMDIVDLKNRVKRLECAITQAVNEIDSE